MHAYRAGPTMNPGAHRAGMPTRSAPPCAGRRGVTYRRRRPRRRDSRSPAGSRLSSRHRARATGSDRAPRPSPPVGPALGQHGLNIQEFCTKFNEATKDKMGDIIPAEITVYEDRTFEFILKTPPASDLLRKAAGVEKGAGNPLKDKVGTISPEKLKEIAERFA